MRTTTQTTRNGFSFCVKIFRERIRMLVSKHKYISFIFVIAFLLFFSFGIPLCGEPNDPNRLAEPKPVIIWFHNAVTGKTHVLEKAVSNGIVTHVLMLYLNPEDAPLTKLKNVSEAIKICKKYNVMVIWARTLWPNYKVKDFRRSDMSDPNYYKNSIKLIRAEARALGADFTGVDREPYALFPFKKIKGKPLSPREYYAIKEAVQKAIKEEGQLDFTLPAGGPFPNHIYDATMELGRLKIAEHTYYNIPWKIGGNAREKRPYDIFGAHINVSEYNPRHPEAPFFTPREILERQDLWAHTKGLFIYPDDENIEKVAEMLSEISDIQPKTTNRSGR